MLRDVEDAAQDGSNDVAGVDMDAVEAAADGEVVENSDGVVVARSGGLDGLAAPDGGKFVCTVCGARTSSEHGAKTHFGSSGHTADDVDMDTDDSESVNVDIVEVADEYIADRIPEAGFASDPNDYHYGDVPDVDGVTLRMAKHSHSRFTDVVVAVESGVDTGDVWRVVEAFPHGSQDAKIGDVIVIIADRPANLHDAHDDLEGSVGEYGRVDDVKGINTDGTVVTAEPPVTPDETSEEDDWNDVLTTDTSNVESDDGETTWDDVREAYQHASVQASPVKKPDARDTVVAALEDETDWMSIVERSEPGAYDLWHWTGDGWQGDGYTHVEMRMRDELGAIASDTEVGHIVAQLATKNYVKEEETNARHLDETLIPVGNGVINVDDIDYDHESITIDWGTVTVEDMDPDHRFLYRVETKWDPDGADLEGLDEWLTTITRTSEARRIIWEFAGHATHPRYPVDGFLVNLGKGGSGKSQTLEVIKAMLGSGNVSVKTMTAIQTERFAGRHVVDKRANINTELEGTKLPSIGTLKTYSAGEETSVEGKGTTSFDTQNDATMMFASDDPPAFPTGNRALGRRLHPVEFPCIYVDSPDPDNEFELQSRPKPVVQAELQADARLKAALMRAVEGLVRILREGRFTSEKSWEERVEQYESFADPIHDTTRACLQPAENGVIETGDLERTFDAYMDAKGHDGKTMQQIWRVMQEIPSLPVTRDRTRSFADDKEKHTVYEGIEFTDAAKENWVPGSAYWDQYTDDEDIEDTEDEFDRVTIEDITERGPGRYDGVKVEIASTRDEPAPWLHDQGVLTDDTGTIRYESPDGIELDEGATYVLKDVIVTADDADMKIQLIDGMTDVTELVTCDDEQDAAVENDETGDEPECQDKVQKDRVEAVKDALDTAAKNGDAKVEDVLDVARHNHGLDESDVDRVFEKMMRKGELYVPEDGTVRVV